MNKLMRALTEVFEKLGEDQSKYTVVLAETAPSDPGRKGRIGKDRGH